MPNPQQPDPSQRPSDLPTKPTIASRPDDQPTIAFGADQMTRPSLPAGASGATQPTIATRPSTQVTNLHVDQSGSGAGSPGTHHGQIWGDFELGDLLGKGGMGAVYRGRQISLDRSVAIKVLPPHLSGNPDFRARFQIEAKAVARIQSAHVIQVYAAGEHKGNHYFAMEFVEGKDLAGQIKGGWRPSHSEVLGLITQAARGLAAAGEHGIIHRDIKPANMMITRKGVLKLMDFGLAKLASGETGLTMAGTIMGTVNYFSPEQGRGDICDCRTDLYALGVVFYELLTGRLPFTGQDATSIIYQHIHQEPRAPKEIDPSIPDPYQAVVLKCMQKKPEDRYQTAQDLLDDLDALREGRMPQSALHDPRSLRSGGDMVRKEPFAAERKGRGTIIAAVILVLAAGGGGGWWWMQQQTPTPTPAPAPASVAVSTPIVTPPPVADQPVVPVPSTTARLLVPDPSQAQVHVEAGRWVEARTLAQSALRDFPKDPDWLAMAQAIDAGEGRARLAQAEAALNAGRPDEAVQPLADARRLLGEEAVAAQALRIAEQQAAQGARAAMLTQVKTAGDDAKAEAILAQWLAEHPDDAEVKREHTTIKARLTMEAERAQAAAEQIVSGRRALERKDLDAALLAFTAALQHQPGSKEASAGLAEVTAVKEVAAGARARFEAALQAKDLAGATAALDDLRKVVPGSAQVVLAENELEQSRLKQQAAERAQNAKEAALEADVQHLAERLRAPEGNDAELATAVQTQLAALPAADARRDLLQDLLTDRRERARLLTTLADLDQAVLAGDAGNLAKLVLSEDLVQRLLRLNDYEGLVFATQMTGFTRSGDAAIVNVDIRHALSVFPERVLKYRLECRRAEHGWLIATATREVP